ncbi:MAG: SanA/YdcF family protein [Planctomycetota bacterium]|jgi:SanA protein
MVDSLVMGNNEAVKIPFFSTRHIKRAIRTLLFLVTLGFVALLWADIYVGSFSKGRIYRDVSGIPHRHAAVVLGCSKTVQGRPNLYYLYRIDAAVQLWKADKVDAILVSGDNSRADYDEPSAMKADLIKNGVPEQYITIDYAGFRTLDSVVRAEQVFGLTEYVIVSQPFHCRRAIYLASKQGQSVIGYCAADVDGSSGVKVRLREVLARIKAVLDVITFKSPKYLGDKESMNYRER